MLQLCVSRLGGFPKYGVPGRGICSVSIRQGHIDPLCSTILDLMLAGF